MALFLRNKLLSYTAFGLRKECLLRRYICSSSVNFSIPRVQRSISSSVETMLRQKDKIPANYDLIYRAPMENYVSGAMHASTLTASMVSLIALYKLAADRHIIQQEIEFHGLVTSEQDLWFFAAGFIAINVAIRVFVSKYPLRIYRSNDQYIAVYHSQLPLLTSQHRFEQGQITETRNPLNPWKHIMYQLGTKSSLLLSDYFKTPSEFHEMIKSN